MPKETADEPITLRDSPQALDSIPPSSDGYDRFTREERITANLRLRSIAPAYRALIGILAFIPPGWRGPLACFVCAILGFLASQLAPELAAWLKHLATK